MPGKSSRSLIADPHCELLTVEQAAHRLGIGRSTLYALITRGDIDSIRIGHLRRIPPDALTAYIARLRTRTGFAGEL